MKKNSHTTEDKFYIQPVGNAVDEVLIIDRIQNDFKITSMMSSIILMYRDLLSSFFSELQILL